MDGVLFTASSQKFTFYEDICQGNAYAQPAAHCSSLQIYLTSYSDFYLISRNSAGTTLYLNCCQFT